MKRRLVLIFVAGIVATALSLLVEYEFCMDGPGRGIPAAVTHPAHGKAVMEYPYSGDEIEGIVFDGGSLGIDVLVWSIIVGVPIALMDRSRQSSKRAVAAPENPGQDHSR
jgi:hypothetical protein